MRTFAAARFEELASDFNKLSLAMKPVKADCRCVIRSEAGAGWLADIRGAGGRLIERLQSMKLR